MHVAGESLFSSIDVCSPEAITVSAVEPVAAIKPRHVSFETTGLSDRHTTASSVSTPRLVAQIDREVRSLAAEVGSLREEQRHLVQNQAASSCKATENARTEARFEVRRSGEELNARLRQATEEFGAKQDEIAARVRELMQLETRVAALESGHSKTLGLALEESRAEARRILATEDSRGNAVSRGAGAMETKAVEALVEDLRRRVNSGAQQFETRMAEVETRVSSHLSRSQAQLADVFGTGAMAEQAADRAREACEQAAAAAEEARRAIQAADQVKRNTDGNEVQAYHREQHDRQIAELRTQMDGLAKELVSALRSWSVETARLDAQDTQRKVQVEQLEAEQRRQLESVEERRKTQVAQALAEIRTTTREANDREQKLERGLEDMRQQLARSGENGAISQSCWNELTSTLQARVAQADSAARAALEEQRRKLDDLQYVVEGVQKHTERDRERMDSELKCVRESISSELAQVLEVSREAAVGQAVSQAKEAVSLKMDEVSTIASRCDERWRSVIERHTADANEKLRQFQETLRHSDEKQRKTLEEARLFREQLRGDVEGVLQQQGKFQLDVVQKEVRLQGQHLQQLLHPQLQQSLVDIMKDLLLQERTSLHDELERQMQKQTTASWERLRAEQGHREADAAERALRQENQYRHHFQGLQDTFKKVQTDWKEHLLKLEDQLRAELRLAQDKQQQTLAELQGEQSQRKTEQVERHMAFESQMRQLQNEQPRIHEELLTQAYAEQAQLKQQWDQQLKQAQMEQAQNLERQLKQTREDLVQQFETSADALNAENQRLESECNRNLSLHHEVQASLNELRAKQEHIQADAERIVERGHADFGRALEKLSNDVMQMIENIREDTGVASARATETMEAITNAMADLREDVDQVVAKSRAEHESGLADLASGLRALSGVVDEQLQDLRSRVDAQQEASCSLADGICGCESTVGRLEKSLRPDLDEAILRCTRAEERTAEQDRAWLERFSNLERRIEGPMQDRLRDYVRQEFSKVTLGQLEAQDRAQQDLEQKVDKIVHAFHTPSGHEMLRGSVADLASVSNREAGSKQTLVARRSFEAALGDSLYVRNTLRGGMVRAASEGAIVRPVRALPLPVRGA